VSHLCRILAIHQSELSKNLESGWLRKPGFRNYKHFSNKLVYKLSLLAAKHKGGYGTALLSLERHRRSKVHQEPMEGMYHRMVEMCTIELSVPVGMLCPTHFRVFLSGYKTIQSVLCFKKLICGMPSKKGQGVY
jgi:endonuclease/exonuclease/phosphatase family metal-dependent hydrolase